MFDRPRWRFRFNGADYRYEGYVGAPDAILLKQHAGLGVRGFFEGVTAGDPGSLIGLVFLAKRHAGENVTWPELVESMVGENDLLALVNSMEPISDEKPAEAAEPVMVDPPAEDKPKVRKAAA